MSKTNHSTQKESKKRSHPFWRWFWLTFLVLSLSYAWYSFYVPSNDIAWASDFTSAKNMSKESNKNILIFFTGKWCAPCRIMKREVFADEEVMEIINSEVVSVIIDIDDPSSSELVKQYKINITPTTIIIDPQGKMLEYITGKIEKDEFLKMLDKHKK
ncbi:thioredoxin family protein [Algibacter sp. PT7-4]|uniref:thioredoxin family protein n=1 Tax=Algibacter ulvanivorans TaxID=3400999 RepID=UPI003AAD6236